MAAKESASRRERTMERVRSRKEIHRQRGRVYRVTFAVVGVGLIALGLVLVPLPGPGWLIVAIGVGMLALEFDRAERLLEHLLARIEEAAEAASRAPTWQKAMGGLVAALTAAGSVAALLLWEIPFFPG